MFTWISRLFETEGFPARWHCGSAWLQEPAWGWTTIGADVAIWAAYTAIPLVLLAMIRRRRDFPFQPVYYLFAAFILACGATHLVEALIFYHPIYRFSASLKVATAVVSWSTVLALVRLFPAIAALRSPAALEEEVRRRTLELAEVTAQLQTSEQRLQLAILAGRMGTWDWNLRDGTIELNEAAAGLFDLPAATLLSPAAVFERVHADDLSLLEETIEQAIVEHGEFDQEFRVVLRGQEIRWLAGRGKVLRDQTGRVTRIVAVNFDITNRKLDEERLRLSDRVLQTVSSGIVIADARQPDYPIVFTNPAFEMLTGYTNAEAAGRNPRFLQGPKTDALSVAIIREAIRDASECRVVLWNYRKDGTPFWNDLTISPVLDDHGVLTHFVGVQLDVTEHMRNVQRLREGESFLRRVLDSLFVFAGVCLPDGTLIEANHAALQAANLEPADVLGKPFPETWWWGHSAATQDQLREALQRAAAGETCRFDIDVRTADGTLRPIDFQVVPMLSEDGRISHLIPSGIDIGARKEFERFLDEARREANQANQAKSEFLASMSHEIRTPLTSILGCADTLAPLVESPQLRDLVQMIRGQARLLHGLVTDILDLSRIEAGKLEIHREPTSVRGVVAEVQSLLQPSAIEKGLELDCRFESAVPREIQTDPLRLQQILLNLVANSIKFTEAGGVTIRVKCEVDRDPAVMRVAVEDTGIGIAPDRLDSIFEPFTQEATTDRALRHGTGLGLTICRRLAGLLDGDIGVVSKLGEGSTFSVELPIGAAGQLELIDPDAPLPAEPESPQPLTAGLERCRVLVVEDTRGIQFMLRQMLQPIAAAVGVVGNGQLAIEEIDRAAAAGEPYDLVLMDMQMPVMDGFEATRRLRAAGRSVPIIALTAGAMAGDRDRCLQAGCDDYLPKPIERDRLLTVIAHAYNSHSSGG